MRPKVDQVLSGWKWMDGWGKAIQDFVGGVFKALGPLGSPLKNLLHGTTFLRTPLHPALTDVPLGAWTAGVIADYMAITTNILPRSAGTVALAVGVTAALGAAATGYTDFTETWGLERRVALAHGLTMTTVVTADVVSLVFRLVGVSALYPPAVGLATFALFLAMFGMHLGGHVVYGFGTQIDRNAFIEAPRRAQTVGTSGDFQEGQPRAVEANGMAIMVVRLQGTLYAISNTCAHAGGPLAEGDLQGDVIECPWHGSRFRVTDGRLLRGPATHPQPKLEVTEQDGQVQVALREPLR